MPASRVALRLAWSALRARYLSASERLMAILLPFLVVWVLRVDREAFLLLVALLVVLGLRPVLVARFLLVDFFLAIL